MKPWREVAKPHKDVLAGTFQQSDFTEYNLKRTIGIKTIRFNRGYVRVGAGVRLSDCLYCEG